MSNFDMLPVTSSNVAAVGYDSKRNVLRVEFNNGSAYDYADVPVEFYDNLITAPSVGQYLNAVIKPAFSYSRVN